MTLEIRRVTMREFFELLKEPDCLTIDRYGPELVPIKGELARYKGARIVVLEPTREDR